MRTLTPPESNGDQNSKIGTAEKNKASQKRQMTRRQAEFWSGCLAAWTLAAGLVGGGFLSYQRTPIGVAFIASALSALALSIHVTYRHLYRSHRVISWLPFIGVGLANLIALMIAVAAALTPIPTFRNVGSVPVFLPKPPRNLIGAMAATSKDMTKVYPLDVVLYMDIFNELNSPRRLRGYSLEIRERLGGWKPICHVDLRDKLLFFTPTGRIRATLLKIDRMDEKMPETMPPYGTVAGFSAWACPVATCNPREVRLLMVDVQGTREYLPASGVKQTDNPHQFLDALNVTFEREDVDLLTAKIMQHEPCRGIER